jgi:hypothetical protein
MFHTPSRIARVACWGLLAVTGATALADPPMPPKAQPVSPPMKPAMPKANPPRVAHPPKPPAEALVFKPAPATVQDLSTLRFVPNDVVLQPLTPIGPAQPAQGRFRVTLRGFRCANPTRDDLLENDGAGDEVIVRCWTRAFDGETVVTNQAFGVNGIFAADDHHGDAFQRFIQAGSANVDHGGITAGNRVAALIDGRTDRVAAGRFPLTVFEGNLVAGRSVALIAPSLWEWDDFCGDTPGPLLRGDPFPTRFWTTNPTSENDRLSGFESAMGNLARTDRVSRLARSYVTAGADTRAVLAGRNFDLPVVRGDMGGNRGIGSVDTGDGITFQPQALILNYAIADRLARAGAVIPVTYVESEGLDGAYTMFLFVERLP